MWVAELKEDETGDKERGRSRLMRFTHASVCKYAAEDENYVSVVEKDGSSSTEQPFSAQRFMKCRSG